MTHEVLVRMSDTLVHRGPDGDGVFVTTDRRVGLAHRRLSIVDPAGGAQPMVGPSGEVLVFNGEIYNYPRLRRQLEAEGVRFETNCDTEVILHMYERHGRDCVLHLTGMFAFALWDKKEELLFFARDPIGEKPLYWTTERGRFVFGSEIKALLAHPSVHAEVNEAALPGYLTNLVTSPPETLYRGIWKLPPGHRGVCTATGVEIDRYWDLFSPRATSAVTADEAASEIRNLLEASVHDRLMADVPVGVLLSGGLDSTALVALLRDRARGLATFSVGFADQPRLDERAEARRVAAEFATDHHEVVVTQGMALDFLRDLVHHQDEPLADPVCIPLHFVCRLARDSGVKVVLAGEGSDELFWGYPRYQVIQEHWPSIRHLMRAPRPLLRLAAASVPARKAQIKELLEQVATKRPLPMHMPLGLPRAVRARVLRGDGGGLSPGWSPSVSDDDADAWTRLGFDTQEYEFGLRLPELLLMRIDRFSMSSSVEARVPFLDPELVRYAYRLPFDLKLTRSTSKVVLRDALADIVPQWVLDRRKQGFGAPVDAWLRAELGALFVRLLDDDEALRRYFDVEFLRSSLRRNAGWVSLWPVMNFALWHRHWIEGAATDELIAEAAAAAS